MWTRDLAASLDFGELPSAESGRRQRSRLSDETHGFDIVLSRQYRVNNSTNTAVSPFFPISDRRRSLVLFLNGNRE